MERPDWAPPGIDIDRPSGARIYDYWLGGTHNFAVDREVARQVTAAVPDTAMMMQANRAFLHRAVQFLVDQGVRQFVDIGSGIPTLGNVHEVAQKVAPESKVVYVDIDPVAVAHSQHILTGNPNTIVIQDDLRRAEQILARPEVTGLLDLSQPVGLLLIAVMHFILPADDPDGILRRLRDGLAPASYVALTHGTADALSPEASELWLELFRRTPTPGCVRTYAEVERLFDGFELVPPGVVWSPLWRPEHPDDIPERPERVAAYAGVGRKP
jgi:hypothetical protein